MNENFKKIIIGISATALSIAMGLQTFVFGQSDLQMLKDELHKLTERVGKLEVSKSP